MPIATGNANESLLALMDGKWVKLRVPYPMGFYTKWMDGRIDDPNGGWKGTGLWSTFSTRTPFHMEGGKGTTSKVVHSSCGPIRWRGERISLASGERPASHRPRRALCKPELRRKGKGRDQTGRSQRDEPAMMKRETFPIAKIYVPAKRRATLDVAKAREIAESILKDGQQTPIMVRRDGDRFVLVEGLHRLEACKQLGEETILGYLVQARLH